MSPLAWPEGRGKWSVWRFHWLIHHKIIRALERARPYLKGALLDVGCGTKPFAAVFEHGLTRYWGADLPDSSFIADARGQRHAGRGPDVFARGEALPFREGSFDTVLGLSMLTYLPEPVRLLEEAHRVLRPGGHLVMEFTQMAPVHTDLRDYFRFTKAGATLLLARAGWEPVEFIPIGGLWARAGLAATEALQRINRGPTRIVTELPVRALYVVLQLWFELLDRLFFDPQETIAHLVVARKVQRGSGTPP
jgi:SAM-dependent methyltransferase